MGVHLWACQVLGAGPWALLWNYPECTSVWGDIQQMSIDRFQRWLQVDGFVVPTVCGQVQTMSEGIWTMFKWVQTVCGLVQSG